jgi:hemolysin activation/secretion protein
MAATASAPALPEGATWVTRYAVQGATLVPSALIEAALQPHLGARQVGDLQAAAQAVQTLYLAQGWGGVSVTLPEQVIEGGVVTLQVTEGQLAAIHVAGLRHSRRDTVLAALPHLQVGQPLPLARIDADAAMANEHPARRLRVVFQPGLRHGEVDALVTVDEQDPVSWRLGLDNSGQGSQHGDWRAGLDVQHASLTGRDDALSLHVDVPVEAASDSGALAARYRWPLASRRWMLEFDAAASRAGNTRLPTELGDLNISGGGAVLGARVIGHLPAVSGWRTQWSASLDARRMSSRCSLGDFGPEGCGQVHGSALLLPLTLGLRAQVDGRFVGSVKASTNLGAGLGEGDAQHLQALRVGASPRYGVLRSDAAWQQRMGAWQWVVRGAAQYSAQALLPAEQMGLGGAQAVRGYAEREGMGDQGGWLSATLSMGTTWRPAVFADAGVVRRVDGSACHALSARCQLASVGVGLTRETPQGLALRMDVAQALRGLDTTRRQQWRAHVSLQYTL